MGILEREEKDNMTDEFENRLILGVHMSRYIASWILAGGSLDRHGIFMMCKWLKTLTVNGEHLTDEDIHDIRRFAESGKLEFQNSAKEFLKGA